MACFIVPAAEAIITTVAAKAVKSTEKASEVAKMQSDGAPFEAVERIPFSGKLKWLRNLLWGGSASLVFEHVWHGELVQWFPFLTKAGNPAGMAEMLGEIATAGVTMSVLATVAWLGMVVVASVIEKKAPKAQPVCN